MRKNFKNMIRCALAGSVIALSVLGMAGKVKAEELPADISISTGGNSGYLHDEMYSTYATLNDGDYVELSSDSGKIYGLYVVWNKPVTKTWTLEVDGKEITCGEDGFIHDYVKIEGGASKVRVKSNQSGMQLSEIYAYDNGKLPDSVQVWEKPAKKADILMFPSHADDEILFFGGIMPTYADKGAVIQVVYMSQFWDTNSIREHEKLDGLWVSGLRNYPVSATFGDYYSETIDVAKSQYDFDEVKSYIVEQIRRFTPSVVVAHDIDGEYGHGYHKLTSLAVREAVEVSGNSNEFKESATKYGAWDVPKTYIHLYDKNQITLNLRTPIKSMNNKTALEIAKEAYKMHWSQQWTWYYVDDGLDESGKPNDYKYSCASFGLYRTKVGNDTSNDMMENVKYVYVIEEEEAQKEAEEAKKKAEEEASIAAAKEAAEKASIKAVEDEEAAKIRGDKNAKAFIYVCIAVILLILSALVFIHIMTSRTLRRRKNRRKR